MKLAVLTLNLRLHGCDSLKAKRSRLKPMLARLRREFNVSVAEVASQDSWQEAVVACALISGERGHAERSLEKVVGWLERHYPDEMIVSNSIEVID